MKTITAGCIGTGSIAHVHARGLQAQTDVSLVAVANPGRAKRDSFADEYGVERRYADSDTLIQDTDIDAVIISTPNRYHHRYALSALRAGKHVFLEKPMACSTAEVTELTRIAKETGRSLMVGHMWRFDREARYVRRAVADGRIGRVFRTTAYGVHTGWGPSGWFTDPELAWGGAMADMGIHAIDTTRFLLGDPQPVRVYARIESNMRKGPLDDTGITVVEWDNGVTSLIESGWWQPHMDGPEGAARLYGTAGYASLFPTRIESGAEGNDENADITVDTPPASVTARTEHCDQYIYTAQIAEFIAAIREERQPIPGGAEGTVNVRIVEAAYASSRTGQAIVF